MEIFQIWSSEPDLLETVLFFFFPPNWSPCSSSFMWSFSWNRCRSATKIKYHPWLCRNEISIFSSTSWIMKIHIQLFLPGVSLATVIDSSRPPVPADPPTTTMTLSFLLSYIDFTDIKTDFIVRFAWKWPRTVSQGSRFMSIRASSFNLNSYASPLSSFGILNHILCCTYLFLTKLIKISVKRDTDEYAWKT